MSQRLTPTEIAEPNTEYIVPDGTPLPDDIKATLAHFGGMRVHNIKTGQCGTRYNIPTYLARQWLSKYANNGLDQ